MEILLQFVATKAVAALIGVVALLGAKQSDVTFTKPEITISDSISINTTLKNSFPKELEKIILSGTPVTIRLKTICSTKDTALNQEIIHRVKYDLADKTFLFVSYCQDRKDSPVKVKDIKEIKKFMNEFNIVITRQFASTGKDITVIMRATIDPIKIEAMENKNFELMAFWDYHTPTLKFVVNQ